MLFVCRMKGAGDLCVKLGLDTPGEEVDHCKVCTRSTTRTVCDGGGGDYSCTSAEKTCVCVCVSDIQPKM